MSESQRNQAFQYAWGSIYQTTNYKQQTARDNIQKKWKEREVLKRDKLLQTEGKSEITD